MKKYKERMMLLLKEIDEICRENNLRYILSDKTAARAKKNGVFLTDPYTFNIMMELPEILRFTEIIRKKNLPDRAVETFKSSPEMENFYFRYVDPTTTVINFKRGMTFEYPCVAINIKPLRKIKPEGFFMKLERAITSPRSKKRVILRKFTKGLVYGSICSDRDAPKGDSYYYFTNNRKLLTFKSDILDNTERIPFMDMMLPVPVEFDAYERRYYGKDWEELAETPYQTVNILQVISETDFSYSEFEEMLKQKGLPSTRSMVKQWKKNDRWYNSSTKKLAKEVERDYSYAKRTVRRFDLYQYYLPMMNDMMGYVRNKQWDELSKALSPYLAETLKYYKMGVGFYVSDDLWKLAKVHWTVRNKLGYAEKVEKLIPKEFLEKDVPALYAKYNS